MQRAGRFGPRPMANSKRSLKMTPSPTKVGRVGRRRIGRVPSAGSGSMVPAIVAGNASFGTPKARTKFGSGPKPREALRAAAEFDEFPKIPEGEYLVMCADIFVEIKD